MNNSILKRIRSKTKREGKCIVWIGSKNRKDGYGQIWHEGRTWIVTRLLWILKKGEIPADLKVCHRCDNPSCVRMSHLFLGTMKDNLVDASKKGRLGQQKNPKLYGAQLKLMRESLSIEQRPIGEKHGSAKLKESQVIEIRRRHEPSKQLAVEYGVTNRTINMIRNRQLWKHIKPESYRDLRGEK